MSLTYQLERWSDIKRAEMDPLFALHWEEIALNKDKIKLDVDYERYRKLDEANMLHIVTLRDDGRLVGYHCSLLDTHLHYKGDIMALTDVYFLLPEYRKGRTGIRLFQVVEQTLKARGITKMITATKLHRDKGRLFEAMGWTEIERVYTKMIR
ncbi:MAG TPA: GNAT family N-acetyltransferase [Candidatus Angelobacter sp.]|nr:GNAT family N-acetyltransferase [Candidatus Angelobacter sp.]